jgi:DNA-binding MarR family transcriptional regulator
VTSAGSPSASRSPAQPGPDTAAARAAVERELTRLLRRARTASAHLAAEVHPDLESAGYTVLVTVLELADTMPAGVRAADLSEAVGLHKSTMSRNITELERLGLLERVPDPSDARARLLQLTPPGRSALMRSRAGRRKRIAQRMERWPRQDLDKLAALLGRLNDDFS